jgi:hypothetical protein
VYDVFAREIHRDRIATFQRDAELWRLARDGRAVARRLRLPAVWRQRRPRFAMHARECR